MAAFLHGQLYGDKMDESKRSSGKCVLVSGAWYSPSEVEALGGKKAKNGGNNLSCTKEQSAQHKQGDLMSQCGQDGCLSMVGVLLCLSIVRVTDICFSLCYAVLYSCCYRQMFIDSR